MGRVLARRNRPVIMFSSVRKDQLHQHRSHLVMSKTSILQPGLDRSSPLLLIFNMDDVNRIRVVKFHARRLETPQEAPHRQRSSTNVQQILEICAVCETTSRIEKYHLKLARPIPCQQSFVRLGQLLLHRVGPPYEAQIDGQPLTSGRLPLHCRSCNITSHWIELRSLAKRKSP